MAKEKLSKIEKPPASDFKGSRKLFFVPLVLTSPKPEPEYKKLVNKYWQQVQGHIAGLEEKLAEVSRVYHELVTSDSKEGIKFIEEMSIGSHQIVKKLIGKGAEIQPIEEREMLSEFMDWGRCLSIGLQSQQAFSTVYQAYLEVQKKRNEYIARRIDDTLKKDENGLLLMREGHQIQFPTDIEVFYVAPPSLNAVNRWFSKRANSQEPDKYT
jgi:hypothetical protein